MKIIGYSERGAMNALFYGMAFKEDENAMKKFLDLAGISDVDNYSNFKLYMEFSLSDFGDPDLVIMANKGEKESVVIFVEAKVSDCSSYSLNKAFKTHVDNIGKQEFVDGETSNLFFQLRLKNRLFKTIKEIPKSEEKYERNVNESNEDFDKIAMTRKKGKDVYRSIGNNPVVRRFVDEIRNCQSALYIAIIPEKDEIKENKDKYDKVEKELGGIYFVTWQEIFDNLNEYVEETIAFNQGPDPLTVSKKLKNQILNTPITETK